MKYTLARITCIACAIAPALVAAQETPHQLAPLPAALPRTHTPEPTTPEISPADLKTRLYIFAADSMEGRYVGTAGNIKGTTYLAAEAKRIGLRPGGDGGSFFQIIPTYVPVLARNSSMTVDGVPLVLWKDFAPVPMTRADTTAVEVVYAGHADEPLSLTPEQTKNKFVVFAPPKGASDAKPVEVGNAFAVGYADWDKLPVWRRHSMEVPTSKFSEVPLTQAADKRGTVHLSVAAAERIFGKPLDQLTPGATGKTVSVHYTWTMAPAPFPSRNVVAILPGSDPVLRNTYVALGAHNDHVGMRYGPDGNGASAAVDHDSVRVFKHVMFTRNGAPDADALAEIRTELAKLRKLNPPRPDSISNGADDDGSGSVSLLEIAENLVSLKVKPKRSVIFVWHTGEEVDMRGSIWFTTHPTVPLDSIVAQINIDMIGRGDASDRIGGGPDYLQVEGAHCMSTELGDLVDSVNVQQKHGLRFHYTNEYYNRSDQVQYAKHGVPAVFFFTDVHPDYHQVTDEPQYIDYDHMARIVKLIRDVVLRIGNLDHRPVVDTPKGLEKCE